jgi:hypothetical protein
MKSDHRYSLLSREDDGMYYACEPVLSVEEAVEAVVRGKSGTPDRQRAMRLALGRVS